VHEQIPVIACALNHHGQILSEQVALRDEVVGRRVHFVEIRLLR